MENPRVAEEARYFQRNTSESFVYEIVMHRTRGEWNEESLSLSNNK